MKKIVALVLCLLAAYCAMPLTSVSSITITLENQDGKNITKNAMASFLDEHEQKIVDIELEKPPSWDNNINWWAHSEHPTSLLLPSDARRVNKVVIGAMHCEPVTLPVVLTSTYNAPSIMPHGAGPAYMYYEFNRIVRLQCGNENDNSSGQ